MDLISACVLAALALQSADRSTIAAGTPERPHRTEATSGFGISTDDGTVLALGPHYRARFGAGSVEYLPALGRSAQRAAPVEFALARIARGGAGLALVLDAQPSPRDGVTVAFDRGAGVEERWTASADGVEMSFVLERLPEGGGDLVIQYLIEHELHGVLDEQDGRALLQLPGHGGGVSIAPPVAIDARGQRVGGALQLEGDRLSLVIPAEFLEHAALPLVVDPLVGTIMLTDLYDLHHDTDGDADFDPASDTWLWVWSRGYASGLIDVVGQRTNSLGTPIGAPFTIGAAALAGEANMNPAVAVVAGSGEFLVAWRFLTFVPPFSVTIELKLRQVRASNGALSPVNTLPSVGASRPRVAGEVVAPHDRAIVAWIENSLIQARSIQVINGGTPTVMSSTLIANAPAGTVHDLELSRNGGLDGRVLAAWTQTSFASTTKGDPWCRAISRTGALLGQALQLSSDTRDEIAIGVDGDGASWVVVWDLLWGPGDRDVDGAPVSWDNGSFAVVAGPLVSVEAGFNDESSPRVAWCGTKTFVAVAEGGGVPTTFDVQVGGYDSKTLAPCELPEFVSSVPNFHEVPTALVTSWSGANTGATRSLLLWNAVVDGGDSDVAGHWIETFGPGVPIVELSPGCGGGTIGIASAAAVGNPEFGFTLQGASPTATLGVLVYGSILQVPIVCGPCSVILDGTYVYATLSSGTATVSLPLPCKVSLLGIKVAAQFVAVLPVPTSPCPAFPSIASSNRIQVTVSN